MPGIADLSGEQPATGVARRTLERKPMDTKYNGWTNYETWCVNLWLTNEEGTYRQWSDDARRHLAEAPESQRVKEWGYSIHDAAGCALAEQLRQEIEDGAVLNAACLYSELLNAALAEVNWNEIAASWLADSCPEAAKGEPVAETPTAPAAKSLFALGRTVATPGALEAVPAEEITLAMSRHERGDWGLVCEHDRAENDLSLTEGFRLMSVYKTVSGIRFWIITEADRSVTTVLLPAEY